MIQGWWFPAGSSARHAAGLTVAGNLASVESESGIHTSGELDTLRVSARVGNIPRRLSFADNSVFETIDNDAVDALLAGSDHFTQQVGLLHRLESHWGWIVTALLATLLTGFVTIYWGMPLASRYIAFALPVSAARVISEHTLKVLDGAILEDSQLSESDQVRIREHFTRVLLPLQHEPFEYRLQFRSMSKLPNAFALPSGDIIVTDRLVELASDPAELDAVLLHEIGHVVHRHGLQQVLHSSLLTVAIVLVTGDASATGNLAVALPIFLMKSHYSRNDEAEADHYAFERMIEAGIDPIHFSTIMEKITRDADRTQPGGTPSNGRAGGNEDSRPLLKYLSSHPPTPDRLTEARRYSELFRRGQP